VLAPWLCAVCPRVRFSFSIKLGTALVIVVAGEQHGRARQKLGSHQSATISKKWWSACDQTVVTHSGVVLMRSPDIRCRLPACVFSKS
jgi:hypothetical protein